MSRRSVITTTVAGVALLCAGRSWAQSGSSKTKSENARLIDSIQGPDLFRAYCASCHGMDGKGKGPMAKALKSGPADLTRIAIANHGTFPLAHIEKVIQGEEQPASGHGSAEMPVWGPVFSQVTRDVDLGRVRIDNLARYIRGIQAVN